MCRSEDDVVRYAPLCIHSFRLIAPRRLLEAQIFNCRYHSYDEIENVPDRLRWCRHHMGMMQKDVAEEIGITRGRYIKFENGDVDYYPKEIVDKLAELFRVPPTDFLDEYNLFLYNGQGKMIKKYRLSLGLKKRSFARQLHLDHNAILLWEAEKKRITKYSWEKYFKNLSEKTQKE
ncbi:MAG: helix-turn-helix domain-containing protein [Clostridia bacterium]|nr:helix-turn-helix domain-containing protein [Clostridia bacterium]